MKWTSLNDLREKYLAFFESKDHLRLPSYPLVPHNDPSLLLINSGMAPMKKFFTGEEEPPRRRVCTCQKCIRTPDLERVGHTARHGTFFEMLGNFSFGDYFKDEAIPWAWEFLTETLEIPSELLWPSIYENDEEAYALWRDVVGVPESRIVRMGKADNFWEHGSGPCGPCSEIYYDRGIEYGCGKPDCTVGCDCDRYIEVWNNVFSQFNNDGNNNYTELSQKNIDTGMGLERLACVCQNVKSLFDVDTVMNITDKVSEITGAHYGESEKKDVSLRIITDHIRSAAFMICDGVRPTNEGRGYVLRRLLRRAARHGKLLGVNDPFLFNVVETVIHENEGHYPELRERAEYITKVIRVEEENFAKTIDAGMRIYNEMMAAHKAKGDTVFSGENAFDLAATYGFPIDLTIEMVEDEGMSVDMAAYYAKREEDKIRAREARKALGDLGWAGVEFGQDMPATEFVGYDYDAIDDAKVLAIVADGEHVDEIVAGMDAIVVLDQTPFYAEMGGQTADHGYLCDSADESVENLEGKGNALSFEVNNVQKNKGDKYMHYGKLLRGSLKVGDTVTASIDTERRAAIRRAHSATHLLDAALMKILGDHVHQAGSLVEPDRLRFDFSHFEGVDAHTLQLIENLVNSWIMAGHSVVTEELPIEEAKQKGAVATFGEKYGDVVRVVEMGDVSVEFCGGTHLDNTAKVGSFRIVSEGSVASGVRRIEAVVGTEAQLSMMNDREKLRVASGMLKTSPDLLCGRIGDLLDEIKEYKRQIEQFKAKASAGGADDMLKNAEDVGGIHVVTATVTEGDANSLRQLGDLLRDKDSAVVAVIALVNEKLSLLAVCGKDAVAKGIKAGDIIKTIAPIVGGKGGGKPDSAMGGGSDKSKVNEALAAVKPFVSERV